MSAITGNKPCIKAKNIVILIDIAINDQGWQDEKRLADLAGQAVKAAVCRLDLQDAASELSLVFTNNDEMRHLNARWRHKDRPTNVLSFPAFPVRAGEKPGPMLGDIILARETIEEEARAQGKPFSNHLSHLIIHGFLHLLGYDHEDERNAEIMERLEQEIVHTLAIPDPYTVSHAD